jgi:glycerate 2-kinase
MEPRAELTDLFRRVVEALSAERLVREACGVVPRPASGGRLVALGLGKAAPEMLAGARSACSVEPLAFAVPREAGDGGVLIGGGHPLPDEGSLRAGEALLAAARSLRPEDAVLLLVSGGGSALAEAPRTGLSLADVRAVNDALVRSGAPIEEMNSVRAHLSRIKGGGLARALYAAGVRSASALVLVDVPRGGPAAVSSGPAAADPTTFADARRIVRERDVRLPAAAAALLERGEETLKPGEPADFVGHEVLCDMTSPATEAARLWRGSSEIAPLVLGPIEAVAERHAAALAGGSRLVCASGEPEVRVPAGAPPGGRAQHLALLMARGLRGREAAFLAAGTDGRDGPTEAAGAVVDGTTWDEAVRRGLDPDAALARFASAAVLAALGATIPRMRTGAHAGELHLVFVP